MSERIAKATLQNLVMSADEAAAHVPHGAQVGA